jgi:hypothetical protein
MYQSGLSSISIWAIKHVNLDILVHKSGTKIVAKAWAKVSKQITLHLLYATLGNSHCWITASSIHCSQGE